MQTLLIINNVPNSRVLSSLHFGSLRFTSFFRSFSSSRICLAPGGGSKPPFKNIPKPPASTPLVPLKPNKNTPYAKSATKNTDNQSSNENNNSYNFNDKQTNPNFIKDPHANYHCLIPPVSKSNATITNTTFSSVSTITPLESTNSKDQNTSPSKPKEIFQTFNGNPYVHEGFEKYYCLSFEELIKKAKKRELLQDDLYFKPVIIQLENDNTTILGINNSKVKPTKVAMSYHNKIHRPEYVGLVTFPENVKWYIVAPTKSDENKIEFGANKHMNLVVEDEEGKLYSIGYFTSNKSSQFLCNKQVKDFQDNSFTETVSVKPQHILFFRNFQRLNKDNFKKINKGQDYLEQLPLKSAALIKNKVNELSKNPVENFKGHGFTREDLFLIIHLFDKVTSSEGKLKHPLSEQQSQLSKEKKELDKKNKDVSEIKKPYE